MNEELFKLKLIQHKKYIAQIGRLTKEEINLPEYNYQLVRAKNIAKELALAHSDCKCHCGATERLSYHHLVLRTNARFMEFGRYISSRNYWNNLLILCWPCHYEIHGGSREANPKNESEISQEKIDKVKKDYNLGSDNNDKANLGVKE